MTCSFANPGVVAHAVVRADKDVARRATWSRLVRVAFFVAAGMVTLGSRAEVPGAMAAITAGDCKTAGTAINEGLQREDAQAYFLAGFLYDRTGCVAADPARAARLYRRASALGDHDAQLYLGLMYGLGRGVPQDYARARRAFAGEDVDAAGPNVPDAVMLGYVDTLGHLAERQVGYPTTANALGTEATLDVVVDPATGALSFDHVKVDIEVGTNLARTRTFTEPLEEAYRAAMTKAPKPDASTATATKYAAVWRFRMREGPSHEKVRLEGYATVGPASAVH